MRHRFLTVGGMFFVYDPDADLVKTKLAYADDDQSTESATTMTMRLTRCHDDSHKSTAGAALTQDCESCHKMQ